MNKKRGQASLFVLGGIILVGLIILFLISRNIEIKQTPKIQGKDIHSKLQYCIEPKLKEIIKTIGERGGSVNPELYIKFQFEEEKEPHNISFLCYNNLYYYPCINQNPLLIEHVKNEIKKEVEPVVRECFEKIKEDYEKKGYSYSGNKNITLSINLSEGKVILDIKNNILLKRENKTIEKKEFRLFFDDYIYDLMILAQEIVNQEADYCDSYYAELSILNPQIDISKFRTSDLNIIYTLRYIKNNETFRFAVRGCVIPPGI